MWGPEPITDVMSEPYAEASGGERRVLYYDKARMEITVPDADPSSIWYVTDGLLVTEMISGRVQLGHSDFEQRLPADTGVAGDPGDSTGPTYSTMGIVLGEPAREVGTVINESIDRAGNIAENNDLTQTDVTAAYFVAETQHSIAAPFWTFMNSTGLVQEDGYRDERLFENPFYATGFPITEAYWTVVKVGGVDTVILLQCFERRCLTYTPGNPDGWQVEAGNVGLHYYIWRYGTLPSVQQP